MAHEPTDSLAMERDDVKFIVDPPCVAPFDNEERSVTARRPMRGEPPQSYFKGHASYQADDPEMKAARTSAQAFLELWEERNIAAKKASAEMAAVASMLKLGRRGTMDMGGVVGGGVEAVVNISPYGIGIRGKTSFDDALKTGEVLGTGQCAVFDRVVEEDGVRFLHLASGRGWIFDCKDGEPVLARLEEMETGGCWHRVTSAQPLDIRSAPTSDEAARTGKLLCPQELMVVDMKARVRGQNFAHLADGRGWVATSAPGAASDKTKSRKAGLLIAECDAEVTAGDKEADAIAMLPATNEVVEVGLWMYSVGFEPVLAIGGRLHGTYLEPGELVKVDKRALSDGMPPGQALVPGAKWLRLQDGRGWVPEVSFRGKQALTLTDTTFSYPSTLRGINKFDVVSASWVVGVA